MNRERVFYLFDRHADGSWTAEEKQELEVYLLNSPEVQGWFWEHARLGNLLREACQLEAGQEIADVDAPSEPASPVARILSEPAPLKAANASDSPTPTSAAPASFLNQPLGFIGEILSGRGGGFAWQKFVLVVSLSMLVGGVLTTLLFGNRGRGISEIGKTASEENRAATDEPGPAATLVNVTNCRWDAARSTADLRSGVVSAGQSLNLLEGVAEVNTVLPSGGFGRLQLEGPLAMLLTSQGMPSVQYGKLAAQVSCDFDRRFMIDTPMGRAVVPEEASIGLSVAANEVELHMFAGEAEFEPFWPTDASGEVETLKIGPAAALQISVGTDGNLVVRRAPADESRFVTSDSLAASQLRISEEYVREIHAAKPLAYWRFESDDDGMVRNEMGDHLACRIYGDGIRWRSYPRNRAAEFGTTRSIGYLMSDEDLDSRIGSNYSVEAWIKPSHLHHGAFFLLIDEPPTASELPPRAGLLMELRGPPSVRVSQSPGSIRFLHRNPPNYAGGTSCYSNTPYELRRWQHVVGVKQGSEMRLYLDGKLIGSGRNSTELADDMRILMGQLHPHDPARKAIVRPFVGELDEVTLYGRALGEREITRHYELGRPDTEAPKKATEPDA